MFLYIYICTRGAELSTLQNPRGVPRACWGQSWQEEHNLYLQQAPVSGGGFYINPCSSPNQFVQVSLGTRRREMNDVWWHHERLTPILRECALEFAVWAPRRRHQRLHVQLHSEIKQNLKNKHPIGDNTCNCLISTWNHTQPMSANMHICESAQLCNMQCSGQRDGLFCCYSKTLWPVSGRFTGRFGTFECLTVD